jgi:hypothetical protein
LRCIQIPFENNSLWDWQWMVEQKAGCTGQSILNGIIFWMARQEKAVVLSSCELAIYIDL